MQPGLQSRRGPAETLLGTYVGEYERFMSRPRAAGQIDAARYGHFLREGEELRNRGCVFPPARGALEKRPVLVETPVRAAFEAEPGAYGFDDSGHDFIGIGGSRNELRHPVLDRQAPGIAVPAHDEKHEPLGIGAIRQVHDRIGIRLAEVPLAHRRHDADDRCIDGRWRLRLRRGVGETNPASERIFTLEVHRDEPLIDDRRVVAGRAVGFGERPSALQFHAERIEVTRADAHHRDVRQFLASLHRPAVDGHLPLQAAERRHVGGDGAALNRGHRAQTLFHVLVQRADRLRPRILRQRQPQLHRQQMSCLDAEIGRIQRKEAAHHETGTRQQHDRQHDFDDDQRAGPAAGAHAAGAAASAALLEHFVDVGLRNVHRRRKPEEHACADANPQQEEKDDRVQGERHPVRLADVGRRGVEEPDADNREPEPDRPAHRGQQDTFDEELPDDAPPAGAERDADRDLARAVRGAGQQEIRHVRAGDEQDERDRAHQREKDERNLRTGDAIVELDQIRAKVFVGIRVLL